VGALSASKGTAVPGYKDFGRLVRERQKARQQAEARGRAEARVACKSSAPPKIIPHLQELLPNAGNQWTPVGAQIDLKTTCSFVSVGIIPPSHAGGIVLSFSRLPICAWSGEPMRLRA
jgi:hypothetical protein